MRTTLNWKLKVGGSGVTSGNSLKKNGGDDGTRTRDLCRDSGCFRRNWLKINGADRPFWRSE